MTPNFKLVGVAAAVAAALGTTSAWAQEQEATNLDEVIVYIAPVTLGAGAPLLARRVELRLEEAGRNRDFVAARYSVVRELPGM